MGIDNRFKIGKLDFRSLKELVIDKLGYRDDSVIQGPELGVDASILDPGGDRLVAVHSDPITAAGKLAGWLSINIASNDVASVGAKPRWASITLLFREEVSRSEILDLVSQIDKASRELEVSVVGGHTEVVKGLRSNIIVSTVIGTVDRDGVVTSKNASPGDVVILTKWAGLEGTAILATDLYDRLLNLGVDRAVLERARELYRKISIVKEALALATNRLAKAMHDPTEGGVLGGLLELAHASRARVRLYVEEVPLLPETRAICRALSIDPLRLISSGSLIAVVKKEDAERSLQILRSVGVNARVVGEVIEGPPAVEVVDGSGRVAEVIDSWIQDEIYRILSL